MNSNLKQIDFLLELEEPAKQAIDSLVGCKRFMINKVIHNIKEKQPKKGESLKILADVELGRVILDNDFLHDIPESIIKDCSRDIKNIFSIYTNINDIQYYRKKDTEITHNIDFTSSEVKIFNEDDTIYFKDIYRIPPIKAPNVRLNENLFISGVSLGRKGNNYILSVIGMSF